jgi:hypothetical protein
MSERAFYSIDTSVLQAFNRLVGPQQRSKIVERLMIQHISGQSDAIAEAARAIENDPSYASVMADSGAFGFENLERLEQDDHAPKPSPLAKPSSAKPSAAKPSSPPKPAAA